MRERSEFEIRLGDLETRLGRLKSLYEQWFQGLERLPPTRIRERFERELRELRRQQPRNTALRFRYQTLYQRYTTLSNYWNRITRQIEEGTYKRDVLRARRRRSRQERAAQREASVDVEIDVDMDSFDFDAEVAGALEQLTELPADMAEPLPEDKTEPNIQVMGRPLAGGPPPKAVKATFGRPRESAPAPGPKAPRGPKPPPKPPKPATGSDMRRIYDQYIAARKKNNERTDNVKFETLARQIKKMVPKLKEKHKGKKIDFEVVVRNGKVGLKPVPKD
ncbi:MAG: MXAN_5187 C-terminal domain-containing protein [Myxococcota bacterium]